MHAKILRGQFSSGKTLIKMHPKSPKPQKKLVIKICMTGLQGDPG